MQDTERPTPAQRAWRAALPLCLGAGALGALGNLLMLTGPVYMIAVYDHAIPASSMATLVALSGLMLFLYGGQAAFDVARTQLLARAGARIDSVLMPLALRKGIEDRAAGIGPLDDIEAVTTAVSAPVASVPFDLPFTALFVVLLFWIDAGLGLLAVLGAAGLMALPFMRRWILSGRETAIDAARTRHRRLAAALAEDADALIGGGHVENAVRLAGSGVPRLRHLRLAMDDRAAILTSAGRTGRMMLQSAALGLGAALVIGDALTAGLVFAVSLFLGRSLAPFELLVQGWPILSRAWAAWGRIGDWRDAAADAPATSAAGVTVRKLWLIPPAAHTPVLQDITFDLRQGEVIGILGPSGAGKSSLLRAVAGSWPATSGTVTRCVRRGYLPQTVRPLPVSVARYVSGLAANPNLQDVTEALSLARLTPRIAALPEGLDTVLALDGAPLSGGEWHRLGLARALCGQPDLVLLDEPEAHADGATIAAIAAAIGTARWWGAAVLVAAHRPEILATCDRLICLDAGRIRAIGPRDDVLSSLSAPRAKSA